MHSGGTYMQALILRLQADVEARKQSRLDLSATARIALVGGILFLGAFFPPALGRTRKP